MTVFANSFSYANGSVQDSRHSRSKIAFSPFLTVNTLLCLLIYMFSSFYEHDNVILMFFLDFFLKAKLIADSEGFLPDKHKRELCIFNEAFSIAKADLVYYHLTFGTFSSFFFNFYLMNITISFSDVHPYLCCQTLVSCLHQCFQQTVASI